jgi:hypothetical protein
MPPKDGSPRKWWPSTQSLDLVEGPVRSIAEAVHAECLRFLKGEPLDAAWCQFQDLDAAFRSAPDFRSVPTHFLVLPTRSRWTVLWNNSFLCDGYDALCACLSSNHRLTTIHWSANDEWTTFQAGAKFIHRQHDGTAVLKRSVQVAQEDKRWHFYALGQPLAEESLADYDARRKRDRLNEHRLMALLERFGAKPWSEDFYALPEQECFVLQRPIPSPAISKRTREQVLR